MRSDKEIKVNKKYENYQFLYQKSDLNVEEVEMSFGLRSYILEPRGDLAIFVRIPADPQY